MDPSGRWRQVESLYHAARTRAPEARAVFLAEACADDERLRRDVESLLAQSVSTDGVLDGHALAFAAQMMNEPDRNSLVGRRLDIYQVLSPLGAGGMGEVYRARDTRLRRDVALKVLPPEFTTDSDRLARFEREARVLAALNHPHIAAIYGVLDIEPAIGAGESGPAQALVLELVEGETLAERIRRRANGLGTAGLPLDDTLRVARQIAEALDAAHEKGIVHRDLKPANIKITPEGVVKVLDFGLAKLAAEMKPDDVAPVNAPTITRAGTREGHVVGTPAYMSPEQARGQAVDKRTDVWAFGCVLYEMLTGRAAFARETTTDTLAAVLEHEPDWNAVPGALHPRLRLLLQRCLEKNVRNRYQGIGDARVDIEQVIADPRGGVLSQGRGRPAVASRRLWPWLAVTAALGALVAGGVAWTLRPSPRGMTGRLTHVLPDGRVFTPGRHPMLAVAPDGSAIVYVASNQLFVRPLDEFEARPIRGAEGQVSTPFFSPDGKSVGYWDAGDEGLKRIDVGGGTPTVLDYAPLVRGASWSRDDNILYAKPDGIWSVSAKGGGQPHLVIPVERGSVHGPQMLPDGRSVLFTLLVNQTGRSWEGAEVVVRDLESGEQQVLFKGEDARYIPTGHVIYALDTTLFAAPFDSAARRVTGRGVPVVEGVRREVFVAGNTSTANYGVTDDGTLVYVHGPAERAPVILRDLVMVDHQGVVQAITDQRRDYWRPLISPDGTRVAVEVFDGNAEHIWVVNVATGVSTQITFTGFLNVFLTWTPDGKSLVFASTVDGARRLFRKHLEGGDAEALGVTGEAVPTDVSHDGTLLYSMGDQTAERAIWTLSLSDRKPVEILATPAQEHHAKFSPDGRWLAYASNASGQQEVYVRPYPIVQGTERRVSEGGGAGPVWAPDGSALYYRGPRALMSAPTPLGPGFVPGRPRTVFSHERFRFSGNASAFDIHPDGKRFIMVTMGDQPAPVRSQINVVFNWQEELKRLVPTR